MEKSNVSRYQSVFRSCRPLFIGLVLGVTLFPGSIPADEISSSEGVAEHRLTEGARQLIPIDTGWTLDRAGTIAPIRLGDSWETEGFRDFDGKGIYRKKLSRLQARPADPPRDPDRDDSDHDGVNHSGRWILEVDGAATAAEVRCNGQAIGHHLGAWTPFRMDVTRWMQPDLEGDATEAKVSAHEALLEIELDERVGHNTQGFLPIVVPHFGGIWKGVRLIHTAGELYVDDLTLKLSGFDGSESLAFEAQVRGPAGIDTRDYEVGVRITGPTSDVRTDWAWCSIQPMTDAERSRKLLEASGTDSCVGLARGSITPRSLRKWHPGNPFLYEAEIAVRDRGTGRLLDRIERRAAIRHFATDGRRLLVNGKAVNIRGILNWGYAPPRLAPAIDEAWMRQELEFAKARGFNLMKFCLWMPPRRYFELADELGILTWVEYPTWHPDFSDQKYEELRTEFCEFFHYDRNSASVILRSLTCETGHGASIDVIRGLYDLGHQTIPGAIIEDDSSWIGWHRVHDFYDDHPYGNNHTWLTKLAELDAHIADRESKPLVLGEAIAADTWEPVGRDDSPAPPHRSLSSESQSAYLADLLAQHRLADDSQLRSDSYRYALQMRKYQMEAFRWRLPDAGYVVSVMRDFPKASMGLIDRSGQPKWPAEAFDWHGPIQLVLANGEPNRSIAGGAPWQVRVEVAGEGALPDDLNLLLEWQVDDHSVVTNAHVNMQDRDRIDKAEFRTRFTTPPVSAPQPTQLLATLFSQGQEVARNRWRLWLVPTGYQADEEAEPLLYASESLSPSTLTELGIDPNRIVSNVAAARRLLSSGLTVAPPIILASRFESDLLGAIEAGGRCVMLADGKPGSFVIGNHWFLRGGPIVSAHPLVKQLNRNMLVDLQSMDLAGPVLVNFPLLEEGMPIVSLWDNHDLDHYRTHSLLWEARIGHGLLICSSLNHGRGSGAAGPFVLEKLIEHASEPIAARAMSESALQSLKRQIKRQQISLADQTWSFRRAKASEVDGQHVVRDEWLSEPIETKGAWEPIRVTAHWDGQGHGDLDGWGFYRTTVSVPEQWKDQNLFLAFTGVDDYFDVFVDGQRIGSGGDLAKRETAFELRKSFPVSDAARRDGMLEIAVRVYDWFGAGGIFRPVYLTTEPIHEGPAWLVPK